MFGKWSIIMPEFLLRVPRWSELGGASDLGLSIVGINYNPIITSIVWTLSSELLQLCSPSLFCQCSIRWQSRDRWSVFVWFIKNIFSMLVWDKSIYSVIAGHDTRYIFTHVLFLQIFMRSLAYSTHMYRNSGTRWHTNMNRNSCKVCEIILRVYESFLQICVCCWRGHMNIKCRMGSEHEIK